uniref:hypothetical protein n=1 Tax=Streptomyces jeddahensis TaxID=1716141 RepID=UPI000A5E7805|nr:hypothetical protein [Streptomyces jeddahensis]
MDDQGLSGTAADAAARTRSVSSCTSPCESGAPGGDRQANAVLHRIVFARLRLDPRTQAYYERRTQEGKTRREIIPCLKRYAAREVFNLVRTGIQCPRYRDVRDT